MDDKEFAKTLQNQVATMQQQRAAQVLIVKCLYPLKSEKMLEQASSRGPLVQVGALLKVPFTLVVDDWELRTALARRMKVYSFYRELGISRFESLQHTAPEMGVAAAVAVLSPPESIDSLQAA